MEINMYILKASSSQSKLTIFQVKFIYFVGGKAYLLYYWKIHREFIFIFLILANLVCCSLGFREYVILDLVFVARVFIYCSSFAKFDSRHSEIFPCVLEQILKIFVCFVGIPGKVKKPYRFSVSVG
jgi:hypothetical protein